MVQIREKQMEENAFKGRFRLKAGKYESKKVA